MAGGQLLDRWFFGDLDLLIILPPNVRQTDLHESKWSAISVLEPALSVQPNSQLRAIVFQRCDGFSSQLELGTPVVTLPRATGVCFLPSCDCLYPWYTFARRCRVGVQCRATDPGRHLSSCRRGFSCATSKFLAARYKCSRRCNPEPSATQRKPR
jgi:hypothetical protein